MNTLMNPKFLFLLCIVLTNSQADGIQRNLDFCADWKFKEAELAGAETPQYDDSDWQRIHLPHDWSVSDYAVQDSAHIGPFYKNMHGGKDVGYLRGGTGWYRK